MKKRSSTALVPVPPQPSTPEIRAHSQKVLVRLVDCLLDHIVTYHKNKASAIDAIDFAQNLLTQKLDSRFKEISALTTNPSPNDSPPSEKSG